MSKRGASGNEEGFPALSAASRNALEAVGMLEDALARIEALPASLQEAALVQLKHDTRNWHTSPGDVLASLKEWLNR